jgi:hypothetical protein
MLVSVCPSGFRVPGHGTVVHEPGSQVAKHPGYDEGPVLIHEWRIRQHFHTRRHHVAAGSVLVVRLFRTHHSSALPGVPNSFPRQLQISVS